MSLRKKSLVAIIFAAINFMGSLSLAINVDKRFIWIAIILPIGAGIYLLTLRCEQCGAPIYKQKGKILGIDITYWGGYTIPKNCSHCGAKL